MVGDRCGHRPVPQRAQSGRIAKGRRKVAPRDRVKADTLDAWIDSVVVEFGPRVLGVDGAVAQRWGQLSAIRTLPVIDALLAATALVHGLTLVTRNTRDLEGLGASLFNPFA